MQTLIGETGRREDDPMITRERIETLATFDARGARVLSLLLYAQSVDLIVPEEPIRTLFDAIYPA